MRDEWEQEKEPKCCASLTRCQENPQLARFQVLVFPYGRLCCASYQAAVKIFLLPSQPGQTFSVNNRGSLI